MRVIFFLNILFISLFLSTLIITELSPILVIYFGGGAEYYPSARIIRNYLLHFQPLTVHLSGQAVLHLEDVKNLFLILYGILSGFILTLALALLRADRFDKIGWKYISMLIAAVVFFAYLIQTKFEIIFSTFHEYFFRNDLWLFASEDTLKKIYPDDFFKTGTFLILTLASALFIVFSRILFRIANRKKVFFDF